METLAVVLERPEQLVLSRVGLSPPGEKDIVVDVEWSGISAGTERLLWSGRMPHFPGMGYPLVPGYESVGRVVAAGEKTELDVGTSVFVPGASCFGEVRGLFGGAAARLVVPEERVVSVPGELHERATLLALAATAYHVTGGQPERQPDLIVGHGVLGRLLARLAVLQGHAGPTVWETNSARRPGATGYEVVDPAEDGCRDYRTIHDVSGDATILDSLIARLAPGGEVVLAGFYSDPLSFAFPPAFMREAAVRVAAQWRPSDLLAVRRLVETGALSLDGLITHRQQATAAPAAYRTAFDDPACLKMVLSWRNLGDS